MDHRAKLAWRYYILWLIILSFSFDGLQAIRRLDDGRSYHSKRHSNTENIALSYATHRYMPSFQTRSETYRSRYKAPIPATLPYHREIVDDSNSKRQLARTMKQKFLEFRQNLETSNHKSEPETDSIRIQIPPSSTKLDLSNWLRAIVPLYKKDLMMKQLRSADERPSSLRKSGLISPPLSTVQIGTTGEFRQTSSNSPLEVILEKRLGASAEPNFDRSILIDFLSLIRLNQRSQRTQNSSEPSHSKNNTGKRKINSPVVTTIVKKSSPRVVTKPRRASFRNDFSTNVNAVKKFSFNKRPRISKRGRLGKVKSDIPTNEMEGMSIYISTMNETAKQVVTKDRSPKSLFGPFSQGNDTNAGISPSEVNIPNINVSQLRLPQSVKDSLSKYLKPLIATLKPLRKTVPGLPGLDYPILSVVPYTNFYCSNMPWPGFYADTEARCQTWHACDVDGRQATFLCPNGTIFNQAMMVCDWWYNVECLSAPFLYPLNERLFINVTSFKEDIKPYTRITPELLDTIFI